MFQNVAYWPTVYRTGVYFKVGGLKEQNRVHVVVECPLSCSLTALGSISFSMKYRFKVLVKIWLPASGKLTLLVSEQMVGTVHKIYRNKVYAVVKNACGGPRNKSHSFTSSLGMLKSEPRSRSSTSHTRVTSIVELLVFNHRLIGPSFPNKFQMV